MSDDVNWPNVPPKWDVTTYNKLFANSCEEIPTIKLGEIIEKSDQFPIPFPTCSARCKILKNYIGEDILEKNINSTYPIVHEYVLHLYANFILHKRKFGTSIEKDLYKDMTIEMLVDRLLTKRAVVFVGPLDFHVLMDKIERFGNWESIGKPGEEEPLVLKNYLSYDEVKLSALLAVSSYSQFINIGNRANKGKREDDESKIQRNGVIVGIVGPRFQKQNCMDYADIIITKEQNSKENGYGNLKTPSIQRLFINFFDEPCLTYKEVKKKFKNTNKFVTVENKVYFNNVIYERRLSLSFDTFLIEANERARTVGKMAYVQVVGYGLGVWRISNHHFLGNSLNNISDICFSYFHYDFCGKYKHGDVIDIPGHPSNGIKVHIFRREPHSKLEGSDEDKLLVVSYAWDGNSLPGNEYWTGSLDTSSDPAAASSSQVAELQNAHINPRLCGTSLRVATLKGLLTIRQYREQIFNNNC
ncbi:hypothetical protein NQ314_015046 [Rhamnusium bicolor]|uniref:Uncharacterized protein n=1 Tax=Rhamnusium bicolor TaxID=1586634 RepID=A0AAV8X0R5_9CUCU|nr:hypothetical protein NQ314_015046 [Rhamnusium bicolor]